MKSHYWIERWQNKDTPWQLRDPEPLLTRYFPKRQNQNVLVPLCGKSVDMLWLKENGHQVFGVELSAIACRSFFTDAQIDFQTRSSAKFEIFESKEIKIWCGDFFEKWEAGLNLDFVYDRAALIALPTDLRKKYSERMTEIANTHGSKNFEMLVILREGLPPTHIGPPFSVSSEELHALYGSDFKIEALETMTKARADDPSIKITDTAYRLLRK